MNSTDKAYQELLEKILTKGKEKGDRTGTGTISIFHHTLEMDMSEGFPLLTTKKMFNKGIIHELLWFLNGDTNIKYLVDNGVNIWNADAYREYRTWWEENHPEAPAMSMEGFVNNIKTNESFSNKWGQLGPVYGKQWVDWGSKIVRKRFKDKPIPYNRNVLEGGTNQIQNAIDTLNNNPDSRRIIVSAWNVGELNKMALPPCHWAFELYTEELTGHERVGLLYEKYGKEAVDREDESIDPDSIPTRRLHLKWHQRSVDVFLGLPFNIASYGFLLHMLAQQTNMVPGTLVGDLTNVHIYKNHIEQCKEQLSREPKALPTLSLNKADSIFDYKFEDFQIVNYTSHPAIKGDISV